MSFIETENLVVEAVEEVESLRRRSDEERDDLVVVVSPPPRKVGSDGDGDALLTTDVSFLVISWVTKQLQFWHMTMP
jgi:hypothetical protein